mmetsp:Transcript_125349/g.227370  ORF Transcript_125349/g.227370 Transcript_125349/m.227370 type:complete len:532 (+) Transcript_125349:69-1664(+)
MSEFGDGSRRKHGAKGSHRPHDTIRHLDVPRVYWGKIIGTGGETLQQLQSELSVSIKVPKPTSLPDSKVTIRGTSRACDACEMRIKEIIQTMARKSPKPSKRKDGKSPKPSKQKAGAVFPKCTLCDSKCPDIASVFCHLGSARHLQNVQKQLSEFTLPSQLPINIDGLVALLAEPAISDLHTRLGYDVDVLVSEAPRLQEKRMAAESLQRQIQSISPDREWFHVEERWRCWWDDSISTSGQRSILKAPSMEELFERCHLDKSPPLVQIPCLPAQLPKRDPKQSKRDRSKAQHMWPFDPTSVRLGLAILRMQGLTFDGLDLICGTSFIKALSGDSDRCRDTFYLQALRQTVCVLHVPASNHGQDDAGHAVENLLSGCACGGCFYCSSMLRIGHHRVLVTSEVDATNDRGDLVELKSSSKKRGMEFTDTKCNLQIAINGSSYVLGCILDQGKTQLLQTEWISAADAGNARQLSFIQQGQRVRFFLERVLSEVCMEHPLGSSEISPIMKLTFNDKEPVIAPAVQTVEVLPTGLD